jgi:hypothetical protein
MHRRIKQLEAALFRPVTVEFTGEPFDKAISKLSNICNINIYIDEKCLEAVKVRLDLPITASLNGVTLKESFKRILQPLGLVAILQDDVIKIVDRESTRKKCIVRVYPLADVLRSDEKNAADFAPKILRFLRGHTPSAEWTDPRADKASMQLYKGRNLVFNAPPAAHDELQAGLRDLREILSFHGVKLADIHEKLESEPYLGIQ